MGNKYAFVDGPWKWREVKEDMSRELLSWLLLTSICLHFASTEENHFIYFKIEKDSFSLYFGFCSTEWEGREFENGVKKLEEMLSLTMEDGRDEEFGSAEFVPYFTCDGHLSNDIMKNVWQFINLYLSIFLVFVVLLNETHHA